MYIIASYGLLIVLLSAFMVARPALWVEMAVRYIRLPYMHPLEIAICIGFGLPFIIYAEDSGFPITFKAFGFMLVAVGAGLMLTPPSVHRRFGIWSVHKTGRYFRPLGVMSLLGGAFLVYVALRAVSA